MRRPRTQLPDSSPLVAGDDGVSVRFALEWSNELISGVQYRSSTCATLLAYCEVACDLIAGMSREELSALSATDLQAMLPEVPAARRSRSELVVRAIRSALAVSVQ
jgi:NifU-like protein involved in Fe-S cluster formation